MQRITVVGPGKMGGALALAFTRCGFEIDAIVYGRRRPSGLISQLSPSPIVIRFGAVEHIRSDILLLTTQDQEIANAADTLAGKFTGKFVFHTSGSMSSVVLAPFAERGCETASIHPLASITNWRDGLTHFANAFFCLEGSPNAVRKGKEIAKALGGRTFTIDPASKPLYHAAAVTAAGHFTALFDVAVSLMAKSGTSRQIARKILWPLVDGVVKNLESTDAPKALTGTYARGDVETARRHLETLRRRASSNEFEIYLDLAIRSIDIAVKAGLDETKASEIRAAILMAKGDTG